MNMLADIFLTLLAGYLAFTNSLAMMIAPYIGFEPMDATDQVSEVIETNSYLGGNTLPRILLENSSYQKAAVVDSISTVDTPASPMEALVNVFCTYVTDEYIQTTTGSGFFINPKGVILTNAHVAQVLLLADALGGKTDCSIRTGSPALPAYRAELLYISPAWIENHADFLTTEVPRGTGERDYALLHVSETIQGDSIRSPLPALPIETNQQSLLVSDKEVTVTGYPASSLTTDGRGAELTAKSAQTTIKELMTFGSQTADLFTLAGTDVGQKGSSGGPVVDNRGFAIGLITTRGNDSVFGSGSLRAISLPYIDQTIKEETGYSLLQNISGDISRRAEVFAETMAPFLRDHLTNTVE